MNRQPTEIIIPTITATRERQAGEVISGVTEQEEGSSISTDCGWLPLQQTNPSKLLSPVVSSLAQQHDTTTKIKIWMDEEDSFELQPQQQHGSPNPRQKKPQTQRSVEINEEQNAYITHEFYFEDCEPMWYTAEDIYVFKNSAVQLAQQLTKLDKLQANQPYSYKTVLERVYRTCKQTEDRKLGIVHPKLSAKDQRALDTWIPQAVTRLGLEHLSFSVIQSDAKIRYMRLMDCVVSQSRKKKNGRRVPFDNSSSQEDGDGDWETKSQRLRRACEDISRPSRTFAEFMGKALHCS